MSAYRKRVSERFGLNALRSQQLDVWIHAVSLGEVIAATPLIEAWLAKHYSVLVTTMTPTGSERVINYFGNRVAHQYLPYDLPFILKRFLKRIKPCMVIIMETELWPNLIYVVNLAQIPLFLANARLSDDAFKSYLKARFFFKPLLNKFTAILAQSMEDAQRYKQLGACEHKVFLCGNMKFDIQTSIPAIESFLQIKEYWGPDRTVIIAASTHDDEERQFLVRLNYLKDAIPNVLLLVAPRHPERFHSVFQLSVQLGYKTHLRSNSSSINDQADVIIIDSLGELLGFYKMSDYAFVGGSLVPIGGHNVLEPIAMQVPVLTGPYMHNAKAICNELSAAGAIKVVADPDELMSAIITMHKNKTQRSNQIINANKVLTSNQGSVNYHMQTIKSFTAVK